jgi:hypothetical protein
VSLGGSSCDLLGILLSSWVDHLHLRGEEEQVAAGLAHQLLARVVVDRDAEVHLAVVVGEDPLDRRVRPSSMRACRSASGLGRIRTLPPRRNVLPSTSASPRRRADRESGGSVGGGSVGRIAKVCGSRIVTRPCSAMMSSGVAAAARAIISRTVGSSCCLDLGALVVAQHLHVQQQRLLDLRRVEQPPRLSGAICG